MNRNSSFFWLTDTSEDVDQDEEVLLQDTGLSIDDDRFTEGTAFSNATLQSQRHEHVPPVPRRTFLPPPPLLGDEEEAQPLLVGTKSYGSQERPLFSLSETSPVERTPPILHKRMLASSASNQNNNITNKNPATMQCQNVQPLRFQVVIWHVGEVDVIHGQVPMRFRITLFWNDALEGPSITSTTTSTSQDSPSASLHSSRQKESAESEWVMKGRQRACRYHVGGDQILETIDVPPVSILNAVSFDTVEGAEITMLDLDTRLMRWTCMYRVDLFQADHMTVEQFPHDWHKLKIKIGILANRGPGGRWDRRHHPLALATESDSRGSTRIPHGLVVEHVAIPDFDYRANELSFGFLPLEYGVGRSPSSSMTIAPPDNRDRYLQVQLPVYRVSGHYDRSIMPLLVLLNIVAITCIPRNFDSATASTETLLSIAFVQVGIRLTIDSRLPSVGYPIKMQKVLNHAFWMICSLALESNVVFFLVTKRGWKISTTDQIDLVAAVVALFYTAWIVTLYYSFERRTTAATTTTPPAKTP